MARKKNKTKPKKVIKEVQDLWGQLEALREYTAIHGILVGAQVDQLKMWGRLVFEHIPKSGVEIQVDFEGKFVTYLLKGGKLSAITKQAKLVAGLDNSVHAMLGANWQLAIYHNDEIIYLGPSQSDQELTDERRKIRQARNDSAGTPSPTAE